MNSTVSDSHEEALKTTGKLLLLDHVEEPISVQMDATSDTVVNERSIRSNSLPEYTSEFEPLPLKKSMSEPVTKKVQFSDDITYHNYIHEEYYVEKEKPFFRRILNYFRTTTV
jgi:hypothetical protein